MSDGKANQVVFAETLTELAALDRDIVVVTSDSRGSGKLEGFAQAFPSQMVEVGIAEQNLVGVAAGLAAGGKKPFAVSPACFLTARALEQIKNDVAYSDQPVKLIGISAGVSYGALGSTHHSLHDFAVLRAIHNLIIVAPADNWETREAVRAAAVADRPIYLRLGKKTMPSVHESPVRFELGKAIVLQEGADVTFVATGETVHPALLAARRLGERGLSCGVVSVHTIKPLDAETILGVAKRTRAIVTVEEHSVHGGLGEACASLLLQARMPVPFRIVGIPDEHTVAGSQQQIFEYYGICPEGLVRVAEELI